MSSACGSELLCNAHTGFCAGETFFPPAFFHEPPVINMDTAREEAEMVLYGAVEELLKKTGLKPRQIDVLVTNCSLFNPTPSLSGKLWSLTA